MATIFEPRALPTTLVTRPWGGQRLGTLRGSAAPNIGESWEFSTLSGSVSQCDRGPLDQVLGRPLPFLAKLIDTAAALSVQVHPPDDPGTGTGGKEEAWIVLDADAGAELFVGLRPDITAPDFAAAMERARVGDGVALLASLQTIAAEPGAIILVPAGTVHAIGAGILLAEIQQPSDCTYRLFDYGRDRELHLDQGLAVTDVGARPMVWRPGDAPAQLRGRHLDIAALGSGTHTCVHAGHDTLLIAVGGACTLDDGATSQTIAPTDLRLWIDGSLRVTIEHGAHLVVASLPR